MQNKVISYEQFKNKLTPNSIGDNDVDLYTDEEFVEFLSWIMESDEELYQARNRKKILVEGIEPEDELTEEEANTIIQVLIDRALNKGNKEC